MINLTGKEIFFDENDIIVSKTDQKGIITYANDTFAKLAEMPKEDVIGKPHNFIRHPHMPKCIFKILWETIQDKKEVFAFVLNRSIKGNEYWVIAHVTPSFNRQKQITGFHSNRRTPNRQALEEKIIPLYEELRVIETKAMNNREGLANSCAYLQEQILSSGKEYNHFILDMAG